MQMPRGPVGMVEVIRDDADLLAFLDVASAQNAVGIHARRTHMHVAKADMFRTAVDLQDRGLLRQRPDHDTVAHRQHRLLLGVAMILFVVAGAGARTNVLPLVAETGGALPHFKAAGLAEIIPPGIASARLLGFVALAEGLRADESRGLLDRKPDLRIGGQVNAAALLAVAAAGNDVADRAVAEFSRPFRRPFDDARW